MGVDLQFAVEIKNEGDSSWHSLAKQNAMWESERNMPLFSLLADIGNQGKIWPPEWQDEHYDKEAGVTVPAWLYDPDNGGHDRIEPITKPRGLPDDATSWFKARYMMMMLKRNLVVASWVTDDEVVNANWDQTIYRQGILQEKDYLAYRDDGVIPRSFAAHAGGPGLRVVNEIEYAAGVRGPSSTAVSARWNGGTLRNMEDPFLDMVTLIHTTKRPTTNIRFMLLFDA